MDREGDIFHEFEYGIGKVGFFLQDILCKEKLTSEAESQRQDCIWHLQNMSNTLHMFKNYPTYENTLNAGLSQSSQELNDGEDEFGVTDIHRSGSLPDIPTNGDSSSKKTKGVQQDSDFILSDMRELVIYDPIEEEDEEDEEEEDEEDEEDFDPLKLSTGSRSSIKRSRKRDSAVLFDISLGDLEDFDLAGFLTEKHSGKDWYCVLMDQHLCLFPSQDANELAYDVVILPCCQISLDDRLMRTPVFRLTQPGMAPWVLVAKDNEELKEWISALTTAASGGKYSLTSSSSNSTKSVRAVSSGVSGMHAITEEEPAEEETNHESTKIVITEEIRKDEKHVKLESEHITEESVSPPLENLPDTPTSPETFGEEIYEAVEQNDEFEDDGFATDEFESGSSENELDSPGTSPKGSPKIRIKTKKKPNQLLKWLKKKTRTKDRLFSSPKDGVALAGYVHRLINNEYSKRWCVVREGKIYCYKNIKDEDTELTLELEGSEIRAKEESKNRYIIRVLKDNERLLTLLTKNTRDMDKWKTALRIESGFIKLTSPVDSSSGVFDDIEGDYITPNTPVGLQKDPKSPTLARKIIESTSESVANDDDEDAYLEIKQGNSEQESLGPLPSIPKSPESESLGPLPSILSGKKSPDPESLGPLPPLPVDAKPPALPPPRKSPIPQILTEEKNEENDEELEDIYEEVKIVPLPDADKLSHWHKMSFEERVKYEEENRDVASSDVHVGSDKRSPFRPPPLARKVSFDEKVEVINTHLPKSMQPGAVVNNGDSTEIPQGSHSTSKPQAEVSPMQQPSAKEMRSLPRKTLKENWIKSSKADDSETPSGKVLGNDKKIEQDKEREMLQKAEEEFLNLAKKPKEKTSTSVPRRPSIVERNRLAFENRKKAEALAAEQGKPRSQSLNKEKADLLAMIEFQKKRVAVAKDRKIFFSFSNTTNNTAVADAEMEFHESQLGLAKAKKRIAEIDNELKNIELLEFKNKTDEIKQKEPIKTKDFRLITDDSAEQVKATDEKDGNENTVRNLKKGNVLSKLKVFENMSNK